MSYSYDELDRDKNKKVLPYSDLPSELLMLLKKSEDIQVASQDTIKRAISMIDSTSLQAGDEYMVGGESDAEIASLCHSAAQGDVKAAAVCVYPNHVALAADILKGTGVQVATVNNFPHGESDAATAAAQAAAAIRDGATEIDTVMDYEACFNGELAEVAEKLQAVGDVCRDNEIALKIILKASVYSSYDTLYTVTQMACHHCRDGDFIKTCTGKAPKEGFDDTKPDVSTFPMSLTMMKAVADYNEAHGTKINLKISGGVKSALDCERYRYLVEQVMGQDMFTPERLRFGASSLLGNLRADLNQMPQVAPNLAPSHIAKPAK